MRILLILLLSLSQAYGIDCSKVISFTEQSNDVSKDPEFCQKKGIEFKDALKHGCRSVCSNLKYENSMFEAVHSGCLKYVEKLLKNGANPNVGNDIPGSNILWDPVIFDAASLQDEKVSYCMTKKLVDHGAHSYIGASETGRLTGTIPYQYAVAAKNIETAKLLIKLGSPVSAGLTLAVMSQQKEFLKYIIAHEDFDVSRFSIKYSSPLQYATHDLELFKIVESAGFEVKAKYGVKETTLFHKEYIGSWFRNDFPTQYSLPSLETLKYLAEKGLKPISDKYGFSPFFDAIIMKNEVLAKEYIRLGADYSSIYSFVYALRNKFYDVTDLYLKEYGLENKGLLNFDQLYSDVKQKEYPRLTMKEVQYLLDNGAELNPIRKSKVTFNGRQCHYVGITKLHAFLSRSIYFGRKPYLLDKEDLKVFEFYLQTSGDINQLRENQIDGDHKYCKHEGRPLSFSIVKTCDYNAIKLALDNGLNPSQKGLRDELIKTCQKRPEDAKRVIEMFDNYFKN